MPPRWSFGNRSNNLVSNLFEDQGQAVRRKFIDVVRRHIGAPGKLLLSDHCVGVRHGHDEMSVRGEQVKTIGKQLSELSNMFQHLKIAIAEKPCGSSKHHECFRNRNA